MISDPEMLYDYAVSKIKYRDEVREATPLIVFSMMELEILRFSKTPWNQCFPEY